MSIRHTDYQPITPVIQRGRVRRAESRAGESVISAESESLGQRVRRLRTARKLTQEELAVRSGVTKNQVYKLERGTIEKPQRNTLENLARTLGVSADYLRWGEDLEVVYQETESNRLLGVWNEMTDPERDALYQISTAIRDLVDSLGLRRQRHDLTRVELPEDSEYRDWPPDAAGSSESRTFIPPSGPKKWSPPPAEEVGIPEEDWAASQEARGDDNGGDSAQS